MMMMMIQHSGMSWYKENKQIRCGNVGGWGLSAIWRFMGGGVDFLDSTNNLCVGLSEEFCVPKIQFPLSVRSMLPLTQYQATAKKNWIQTLVSSALKRSADCQILKLTFLMSVHYLCEHCALAKRLCLQLLTYQCQFPKTVLGKRKYVTLYAESWREGRFLPSVSELWEQRNYSAFFCLIFAYYSLSLSSKHFFSLKIWQA